MVSGVTSRTESLVIVPTVPVMIPTRLAEPQVWAPTGSTASGITTGTTGRPTTDRLDTGSTPCTVVVHPTSCTVRVQVRPTGSIVRVPEYEYYEHCTEYWCRSSSSCGLRKFNVRMYDFVYIAVAREFPRGFTVY